MNKKIFNYKSSVLSIILKTISAIVLIIYVIAAFLINDLSSAIAFSLTGISYSLVIFSLATILQHVYEIKQLQEHTLLNKNEEDN